MQNIQVEPYHDIHVMSGLDLTIENKTVVVNSVASSEYYYVSHNILPKANRFDIKFSNKPSKNSEKVHRDQKRYTLTGVGKLKTIILNGNAKAFLKTDNIDDNFIVKAHNKSTLTSSEHILYETVDIICINNSSIDFQNAKVNILSIECRGCAKVKNIKVIGMKLQYKVDFRSNVQNVVQQNRAEVVSNEEVTEPSTPTFTQQLQNYFEPYENRARVQNRPAFTISQNIFNTSTRNNIINLFDSSEEEEEEEEVVEDFYELFRGNNDIHTEPPEQIEQKNRRFDQAEEDKKYEQIEELEELQNQEKKLSKEQQVILEKYKNIPEWHLCCICRNRKKVTLCLQCHKYLCCISCHNQLLQRENYKPACPYCKRESVMIKPIL